MLADGVIRPSSSFHVSPLLVVPKKNGTLRPCIDYRAINAVTIPDKYTLPRIDDMITRVKGNIFSAIDLTDGFHHIPVAPEDIEKTAVATPFGSYEFIRLSFGLKSAPVSFQRCMDNICRDLQNVLVYIDDILIFSENEEEHTKNLRALFRRLGDNGMLVNKKKS